MKEYIYLWIDKYKPLDDLGGTKYLYENAEFFLSSKYEIKLEKKNDKRFFDVIERSNAIPENYFSNDVIDIKAFFGTNGSGKTSLLKLLYRIISKGYGGENSCNFILIYKDEDFFCVSNGIDCRKIDVKIQLKNGIQKKGQITNWEGAVLRAKSPCSVFYSSTVNDVFIRRTYDDQCFDISTNALLHSDDENFYGEVEDRQNRDHFSTYVLMEMLRKTSFAVVFYDLFKKNEIFRMPNLIIVAPSYFDKQYALKDIEKIDKSVPAILKEIEKKIVKKDDFNEYLKYSAFLNRLRYLCTSPQKTRVKKILSYIKSSKYRTTNILFSALMKNGENVFCEQINKLVAVLNEMSEEESALFSKMQRVRLNLKKIDGFYFDLKRKFHLEHISQFVEIYQKIAKFTPFLTMNFRAQSAGEENVFKFFSRFFNVLNGNDYSRGGIHLFIDEADLYLHPEWQRCWLKNFLNVMKVVLKKMYPSGERPKIQLFLTTHSPFIITDLFSENITLLDRKNYGTVKVSNNHSISPFGGNMYDFLDADGAFFLENSIGAFAEDKIRKASVNILDKDPENEFTRRRVGDPIIKCLINEVGLGDD